MTGLLSLGWYASRILPQLGGGVEMIAWKTSMAISIGAFLVLITIAAIFIATTDRDLRDNDDQMDDERDRAFERRGDAWSGHIVQGFVFLAIGLAMFDQPTFWVANSPYVGVMLGGAIGLAIRQAGYRGA